MRDETGEGRPPGAAGERQAVTPALPRVEFESGVAIAGNLPTPIVAAEEARPAEPAIGASSRGILEVFTRDNGFVIGQKLLISPDQFPEAAGEMQDVLSRQFGWTQKS